MTESRPTVKEALEKIHAAQQTIASLKEGL